MNPLHAPSLRSTPARRRARLATALATLFAVITLAPPALALDNDAGPDAQRIYQRERARCNGLQREARANCLSDASTVAAAAQPKGREEDPARYARNAIERCKVLPADDRTECLARMHGLGTMSGSVAGGGIYRELRSVQVR